MKRLVFLKIFENFIKDFCLINAKTFNQNLNFSAAIRST
jgi:hypothetical protein